jgi:dTDP-4-amino-4,6-dideoxygalactose transaminase
MNNKLAFFGGSPVRTTPFPSYDVIGEEEKHAVMKVLDSGILSRFLGAWHDDFYGGPEVQAFEREWATATSASHAVSVNSCTSGLYAAVGAAGVGPGDEVIVSPYTMAASATAAIIFQGVPIFADIDPETYCISAETIRAKITPRTKAIIVVHIFGQAADMDPIMELARKHDIVVIEDCAQVPFATYKGRHVGSLGDMGVFSLNYHKHIHTGEGGLVTTDNDRYAERLQLIRNHAEAVVAQKGVTDLTNMIGFNFRMGEIEAAIGREQLKKGPALVRQRQENVRYLEQQLVGLEGLRMPFVSQHNEHVYYKHTMDYDASVTGVSRERMVQAIRAELPVTRKREGEGPLVGMGYVKPIYLEPMYQSKIAYGRNGYPFISPLYNGSVDYSRGSCPNVERAHFERVILHELMRPGMSNVDLDDVAAAFHKVWRALPELEDTVHGA